MQLFNVKKKNLLEVNFEDMMSWWLSFRDKNLRQGFESVFWHLGVPQFSRLYNGDCNNNYISGLQWGFV